MTVAGPHFFQLSLACTARTRLEEAEGYYLAGNLNEALAAAQQAWREHPREPDVFRVLAYLHMARGEFHPAEQAARQAVLIDAAQATSHAMLAQVYLAFNMLRKAEETLVPARLRFVDDCSLATLEADLRFRLRQDVAGEKLARAVLAINPRDGYVQALLGSLHFRRRQYRLSIPLLTEAVTAYPQRWDYLRDLGVAYLHLREGAAAAHWLRQSYRLNPVDRTVQQQYALALGMRDGRHPAYWTLAVFFYDFSGWGWVLNIAGMIAAVVGVIWVLQVVWGDHPTADLLSALTAPLEWLVSGVLLVLLTYPGLTMRRKQGERFEMRLQAAAEEG